MLLILGGVSVIALAAAGAIYSTVSEKEVKKTQEPYSQLQWYAAKLREVPSFDINVKAYQLAILLEEYAKVKKQVTTIASRRLVSQDIVAAVRVLDLAYNDDKFHPATLPTISKLLDGLTTNILKVAAKNTQNLQSLLELEMDIIEINKER